MSDPAWRPTERWLNLWVTLSFFGMGCFMPGLGLIYIGLRGQRPDWWIPGIVHVVTGVTLLAAQGPPSGPGNNWLLGGYMAAGAVAWAYFFWISIDLDRRIWPWRGRQVAPDEAGDPAPLPAPPGGYRLVRDEPPTPGGAGGYPAAPPDPVGLPAGLVAPPGDYFAAGPAASAATASAPPDPIDVNTAEARQLTTLPGFDPGRVKRVLAERRTRRGFGSVEEFAAAANLAPHEFVRVRDLVMCTPRRPDPPQPPTQGRILDV